LIHNIVIANYDRGMARGTSSTTSYRSKDTASKESAKDAVEKEWEAIMALNPEFNPEYQKEFRNQFATRERERGDPSKKDAEAIAKEILRAFRRELIAAKDLIESDSRPREEKLPEITRIEKALYDISYHTQHWVKRS
jgi:hypothetical protein